MKQKLKINQKVVQNNGRLELEIYSKKRPLNQKPIYKPPNCFSCNRNKWTEFSHGYLCQTPELEIIINQHDNNKIKNLSDSIISFSTRLPYVNKKTREKYYFMANAECNTTGDMINDIQNIKRKLELNFHKSLTNFCDEMTFRRED